MPDSVDNPPFSLSVGATPEDSSGSAPDGALSSDGKPLAGNPAGGTDIPVVSRSFIPSDTLFNDQWHLNNSGQLGGTPGIDINVTAVWEDYTGAGIRVGVVDDGVEYTHQDLNGNYNASLQYDYGSNDADPFPGSGDFHGTAVAGLIAAENDGIGAVGVAFDASVTGFRIFGGAVTEGEFADVYNRHAQSLDVSNNSWGYNGFFYDNLDGPNFDAVNAAIDNAVTNGRDGLGNVLLWAAGNDRLNGQDVNYHGFQNARETIAVAAIENSGEVSFYSTPGAAILIGAPSNGGSAGITTTDRTGAAGYAGGDYTFSFGGTSAATPITAGVVALILEANSALGYRDVQEILAYTARQVDIGDPGWAYNGAGNWNGGGLHVSHDFGFGLVDAYGAVRLAETWTAQSTRANEASLGASSNPNRTIIDNGTISDSVVIGSSLDIDYVEVDLNLTHSWIGDLVVTLTAPDGTQSVLINRPGKSGSNAYGSDQDNIDFTLSSTHHWGETGAGVWTLEIEDHFAQDNGVLIDWTLNLFGDAAGSDDLYVYTDEFGRYAGDGERTNLSDSGGVDTINAAAATGDSIINLATVAAGAPAAINNAASSLQITSTQVTFSSVTAAVYSVGGKDATESETTSPEIILTGSGARTAETLAIRALSGNLAGLVTGTFSTGSLSASSVTIDFITPDTKPLESGFFSSTPTFDTAALTDSRIAGTELTIDDSAIIENAVSGDGNDTLIGNDAANWLYGGRGNDILIGGFGDDTLDGGSGSDLFVVGAGDGNDVIDGFVAGAGSNDVIDLTGVTSVNSFAQLISLGSDNGTDTTFNFTAGDSLLLRNVSLNSLIADDFVLADGVSGSFEISDATASEGDGAITFTVTRLSGSDGTVTVDYQTANGSATAPADYAAASGTLTFAPGETTKTITVSLVDDTSVESAESFSVALSNATGGATITDGTAVAQLLDNDVAAPSPPTPGQYVDSLSDLNGTTGFKILGERSGDAPGKVMASIGDINGDGMGDILISAPYADSIAGNSGAAYIVFGQSGSPVIDLSLVAQGTGGFKISGEDVGGVTASELDVIGDVNGDGYQDIIINAPTANGGVLGAGAAYVVFGRETPESINLADVAEGTGGFKIEGSPGERLGRSVSGAGDVNGDGFSDFVVGSQYGGAAQGKESGNPVYVVFGSADIDTVNLEQIHAGTGGFTILGALITRELDGIGDFNGDGFDDLLVGNRYDATDGHHAGAAYVVFGSANSTSIDISEVVSSDLGFRILGEAPGDEFGGNVAGAGDVNGDGLNDIIVSAERSDSPTKNAGAAYVFFGATTSSDIDLRSGLDVNTGIKISGENSWDLAGSAISTAGDVNGDGLNDILIGARGSNIASPDSGRVYVVFGDANMANISLQDVANGVYGFKIAGETVYTDAGRSVAYVGDVNGDGIDDFATSARRSGYGYDATSAAYVIFGGPPTPETGDPGAEEGNPVPDVPQTIGTDGDDSLFGGSGSDTLNGGDGNDYLFGNAGDDLLNGGAGNDWIDGGSGNDQLVFSGNFGFDIIDLSGNLSGDSDTITFSSLSFDDAFIFLTGDDLAVVDLTGGGAALIIDFDPLSSSSISAIEFSDHVIDTGTDVDGNGTPDVMEFARPQFGSSNVDVITATENTGFIWSGQGSDTLTGVDAPLGMYAGPGHDILNSGGMFSPNFMVGGDGNDTYNIGANGYATIYDAGAASTFIPSSDTLNLSTFALSVNSPNAAYVYEIDNRHLVFFEEATEALVYVWDWKTTAGAIESYVFMDGTITHSQMRGIEGSLIDLTWEDLGLTASDVAAIEFLLTDMAGDFSGPTLNLPIGGTDEDDALLGYSGDNLIYGAAGNDVINGNAGNDVEYGGTGNDRMFGYGGNDQINGGAGFDTLDGGIGDDILRGGSGGDLLKGGTGNDRFVFGPNDGLDTISDFVAGVGSDDVLDLREITTLTNLADVLSVAIDNGSSTTIKFSPGNQIMLHGVRPIDFHEDDFLFSTPVDLTLSGTAGNDILTSGQGDDTLTGLVGDDTLLGGGGDDTYVFTSGDGNDLVSDTAGSADVISVSGLAPGAGLNASTRSGDDLLLSFGTQTITIAGHFAGTPVETLQLSFTDGTAQELVLATDLIGGDTSGILTGTDAGETLDGGGGDDILFGAGGDDTLFGGLGADVLVGGSGNDTLIAGALENLVRHSESFSAGTAWNSAALNIATGGAGPVAGATASLLTGNSSNGRLYQRVERLTGGQTYTLSFWHRGDGFRTSATASDFSGNHAVSNVVASADWKRTELTFTLGAADSSFYFFVGGAGQIGNGNTVELWGAQVNAGARADGYMATGDTPVAGPGIADTAANTLRGGDGNDTLVGAAGDDTLIGGAGDDSYFHMLGDGNDRIEDSTGASDILIVSGLAPGTGLSGTSQDGNDLILSFGPETVTIADHFIGSQVETLRLSFTNGATQDIPISGDGGISNTLTGTQGIDTLTGGSGDDMLTGFGGDDVLLGGGGDDTYIVSPGDGNDTITDSGGAADLISVTGLTPGSGLTASARSGNDLQLGFGSQTITVAGHFAGTPVETLQMSFTDSTTQELVLATGLFGGDADGIITGTAGSDTLDGGGGDDILFGAGGDDTLIGGLGADVLEGGSGEDTLIAGGVENLVRHSESFGVGTAWNSAALNIATGGAGPVAGATATLLTGNSSNGRLYQRVEGLTGGQTYTLSFWHRGDGFRTSATASDFSGNHAVSNVGASADWQRVEMTFTLGAGDSSFYFFIGGGGQIGNGNTVELWGAQVNAGPQAEWYVSTGDTPVAGPGIADTAVNTLRGGDGNDTLVGAGGDDTLIGGLGADVLEGGAGEDTLIAGGVENLVRHSESFGVGTAWNSAALNIATGGAGPVAGATATLLTGNSSNGRLYQRVEGLTGGQTYTLSFWHRGDGFRTSATASDFSGNHAVSNVGASADWQRVEMTFTLGAGDSSFYFFIGGGGQIGNGNTVELWGAQVNAGPQAEWYVSTGDTPVAGPGIADTAVNTLRGGDGNDTLVGAAGDDTLIGGAGDDSYFHMLGGGNDRIEDSAGASDTLFVSGLAPGAGLSDTSRDGNDLILFFGTETVTIADHFTGSQIETLRLSFTNGATQDISLSGGSGISDTLTGTEGIDTLTGGSGDDMITGFGGDDTLIGGLGADVLDGGAGADTLFAGTLENLVRHSESFGVGTAWNSAALDITASSAGPVAGATATLLTGNSSNGRLYQRVEGLTGGQTYTLSFWHRGDGFRTSATASDFSGNHALLDIGTAADWQRAEMTFTLGAGDSSFYFFIGGGGQIGNGNSVELWGAQVNRGGSAGGYIATPDTPVVGTTDISANTLTGGAGDDALFGDAGDDTYLFGRGDGTDTLHNQGSNATSTDTLRFAAGISAEQLWLTQSGDDLNIRIIGSNDQLLLSDWFSDPAKRVDRIEAVDEAGILESNEVQALVDAMAAFAPPTGSDPDLSEPVFNGLQGDIAAAWDS